MKTASCYLSIELDTELAKENPLEQIRSALEDVARRVIEFELDQTFSETLTIRDGKKRIGEAELTLSEEEASDAGD